MTNKEDKFQNLPHLSGEAQIMWSLGYWDGPLSGILLYENDMCYFKMFEEVECEDEDDKEEKNNERKHAIYALSLAEQIQLKIEHALWQIHIGFQNDYWPINFRSKSSKQVKKKYAEEGTPKVVTPVNHYCFHGASKEAYEAYQILKALVEAKYGKFTVENKEPIGFVYHDQLYGK